MSLKIVQIGVWTYDGTAERSVDIVALDYDWWYELAKADDQLEGGERPKAPDSDGSLYYVRFQRAGEPDKPTCVDSDGHNTSVEPMNAAQKKAASRIIWSDPSGA